MRMITTSATILGLAGAVALMTPVLSAAQMRGSDPWEHTMAPGSDGKCWVANDRPYMEHGTGYWGSCPKATPALAVDDAHRARAQAPKPAVKRPRH